MSTARMSFMPFLTGMALACALACHAYAATDLTTLSLEQLMDIPVMGASKYEQKQSEVAAAVRVITREEIRNFGWRTLDQALNSLPGMHSTYDRQYRYLGTRGFGIPGDYNTRVLVTINGNRINDTVYDQGSIGREFPLDLQLVERIEFIPGPGSAVYGQNAMFGVINVVTRSGADVDGSEIFTSWQQPQGAGALGLTVGKRLDNGLDILLGFSGLHASGENLYYDFGNTGLSGVAAGMDGEHDGQVFARLARGPWALELLNSRSHKDDPTGSYFADPLTPNQYIIDIYTLAQVQYQERFLDDTLQVVGRLFSGAYRFEGLSIYAGAPLDAHAVSDWQGVELRLLSTAIRQHKLMLGLELQDNQRIDMGSHDRLHPARSVWIARSGFRNGIYLQDEYQLSDGLTATAGLRVDRNDTTGTSTSPRLGLIWQPGPATSFKALYGRAHRAPNAYERDYADGVSQVTNPALAGERVDTLEFVADHRVGNDLSLRGSVYQWNMHDLVSLGIDPLSGLSQYQSGETVRATGIELSADKTWNTGVRLRASLSLQQVRNAAGANLVNSPDQLVRINVSTPLPCAGLHLGYELQYDSQRLSLDGHYLGAYTLSHLHLRTDRLVRGLELGLGVRNLLDQRYAHPAADTNWQNALEQDGRSLYLQAVYRL